MSSTDCELSPTVVREPSSIFGGLVLNPSVKKREQEDSPYLSKSESVCVHVYVSHSHLQDMTVSLSLTISRRPSAL